MRLSLPDSNRVANVRPKLFKNQARPKLLPLSSSLRSNPLEYMRMLGPTRTRIIDCVLYYVVMYKDAFPSQSTIADYVGIGREHCNRLIQQLVRDGILAKVKRNFTSCLYKLSSFFTLPQMRSTMSLILPTLKALSFSVVTVYNLSYMEYKEKNNYTDSKRVYFIGNKRVYKENFKKFMLEKIIAKDSSVNPISLAIRSIQAKDIVLSKWGQIKLSPFPDEAIEHCSIQLGNHKNLTNPFNCLFYLLLQYCQDRNIVPDWSWGKQLENAYQMPKTASMVLYKYEAAPPSPFLDDYEKNDPFADMGYVAAPKVIKANDPELPKRELVTSPAYKQQFVGSVKKTEGGVMGMTPSKMYQAPEVKKLSAQQGDEQQEKLYNAVETNPGDQFMLKLLGPEKYYQAIQNVSVGIQRKTEAK
jgi:hypothetical protein